MRQVWPAHIVMEHFSPDYSKRDYLLPAGCKDLIDVLRLQEKREAKLQAWLPESSDQLAPWILPPVKGELQLSDPIMVEQLAAQLHQKPFKVIAELMQLGVFATAKQAITFEAAAKLLLKYGYRAKRSSHEPPHGPLGLGN